MSAETSRRPPAARSPAAARKRKRLMLLVGALVLLGVAAALVLTAFRDSIVFFYTPSELAGKQVAADRPLRIGGLVEAGSLSRDGDTVRFRVTDTTAALPVAYRGVLPDLFRECQGVIAEGVLGSDGIFQARQVLAKHDENYMPPEIAHVTKPDACRAEGGAAGGAPAAPPSPQSGAAK